MCNTSNALYALVGLLTSTVSLTVFEISHGECDAMIDLILNDLKQNRG